MDKNNNPRWHGRAILQFGNDNTVEPMTTARNCSSQDPCYIFNCPFTQYGSALNTICVTMQNMTSHPDYIDKDLVSETTRVTIQKSLSLTAVEGTDEEAGFESINYRSMVYPMLEQPIIYNTRAAREKLPCTNSAREISEPQGQRCYHNIVAQYNDIIEFLIVNPDSDQHPIHMHGSFFHIIEQGLSVLNKTTGIFIANNPNVVCDEEDINCQCANCTINAHVVKDTMIVPSGG